MKVFTALFNQIKENIMKMKYNGIADAAARFVEKEQLKNRSLWKLTADQFANCTFAETNQDFGKSNVASDVSNKLGEKNASRKGYHIL